MRRAGIFSFLLLFLLIFGSVIFHPLIGGGASDEDIQRLQSGVEGKAAGERIAFWAEQFIGLPYDKDPQGEYVTRAAVVVDERVDCMYLTFRAAELALTQTPEEAVQIALYMRFQSKGILQDGRVLNYEDRFQYGEDMVRSGKWGREITSGIGQTTRIRGSRGQELFEILPSSEILRGMGKLKNGDLIFFMKAPEQRLVGEAVGHIGIVKIEGGTSPPKSYLIHASGTKSKGGAVRKVPLQDYLSKMPFIGVKVTRFD